MAGDGSQNFTNPSGSSDPNAPGRDANPNADPYFQGTQHARFSGAGTNNRSVDEFTAHNSYGGTIGGADQAFGTYRGMGQAAAGRGAYQADYSQNNQSRDQQAAALGLQRDAALGNAPSVAQLYGRNMLDQSLQAQQAAAASARGGPLAQAAAQSQAANAMAGQQQQGVNNLAALRAQEMAQARGEYFGAASGMRGQDLGQTAQQIQNEQFQRGLNQQGQQFYEGLGQNVEMAQLQANQNAQRELSNEFGLEQGIRQGDEGLSWDKMKTAVGVGAHAVGTVYGGVAAAAAHGGPVHGNAPYLVGEQGPELVVPKKDGFVLTALQTAKLLGAPPTEHQKASLASLPTRAEAGPVKAGGEPPAWLQESMASVPPMDYSRAAPALAESNRAEAAKIRAGFEPSIGDTAQAQYDKSHRGGRGLAATVAGGLNSAGDQVGSVPTRSFAYQMAPLAEVTPIQVAHIAPYTPARGFGGPISGGDMDPTEGSGMVLKGGGLDVMGSLAKTNAIDTNYLHHAGSGPMMRAAGGPVAGADGVGPSISTLYNQRPARVAKPVTLTEALSGIEQLKARLAELEGRNGR